MGTGATRNGDLCILEQLLRWCPTENCIPRHMPYPQHLEQAASLCLAKLSTWFQQHSETLS